MREKTAARKEKTKQIESYEDEITAHGRAHRRGQLIGPRRCFCGCILRCASSTRGCPGAPRRCDRPSPRGCCPCGRNRPGLPHTGLRLGARILVWLRPGPRLGGWLLETRSGSRRLCASVWRTRLWLASALNKTGAPPHGPGFSLFHAGWAGGTRKRGRARALCALLFGQKMYCENGTYFK